MSLVWVVPVAVLLVGLVPVLAVAARVAAELRALRDDVDRWRLLQPALVETRDEAAQLRAQLEAWRDRR